MIAVLLSLAVHLAAALFLVYVPRFLPSETPPEEPATVELLMVEQKGAQPSPPLADKPVPNPPEKPAPPARQTPETKADTAKTEAPKGEAAPSPSKSTPAPTLATQGDEPVPAPAEQPPPQSDKQDADQAASQPPPSPQTEAATEATAVPAPSSPQKVLDFNLEGTDSESSATVMDSPDVIPALPDDRFRNRPPLYPIEAQMAGQHGEVVVVVHVAESGLAAGADVMQSSGARVLDEAALTAVLKWHFHPAIKDGKAVPFDFPFRFIFEAN